MRQLTGGHPPSTADRPSRAAFFVRQATIGVSTGAAVEGEVSALDPARADEFFKCRGRDSNPHGGCPPENFKSSRFCHNYVKTFGFHLLICENV